MDRKKPGWGLTVVPLYITVSNITVAVDVLSISFTRRSNGIGWRGKSRSLFALYYDVDTTYMGDKRTICMDICFYNFGRIWQRTFKPKIYPCDLCHQPVMEKDYENNAGRCKDCAVDWNYKAKR